MNPNVLGLADHALIAVLVLLSLGEAWWYWPRIQRAVADSVPGTRMRALRNLIVVEWALAAAVIALWVAQRRAWAALHFGAGRLLPTVAGAALVAGYVVFVLIKVRPLLADPARLVRFAARRKKMDPLAPRTIDEHRLFRVLAVSAGLCEEFVFRGFVLWYFTTLAGPVAGFALAAALFGLGHLYLGRMHMVQTAIVGAVFGLFVIATGSLWVAIALHAAIDLIAGEVGGRAFHVAEEHAAAAATAPA